MSKRYTEACDKNSVDENPENLGIAWDTEADAFQANKITVDRLCDMQKIFAMSLSLAFRMTPRADIRDRIEKTTRNLQADYKVWHAEWLQHPQYDTLILRLNHHIDVYEELVNWIHKETSGSTKRQDPADKTSKDVLDMLKGLSDKVNQAGGLLALIAENTTPNGHSKKRYPVSQSFAAAILTQLGWPTTSRTIQNWEAGIGTPEDYSKEKCRISLEAFHAWAKGYVAIKKFNRKAQNDLHDGKDIK